MPVVRDRDLKRRKLKESALRRFVCAARMRPSHEQKGHAWAWPKHVPYQSFVDWVQGSAHVVKDQDSGELTVDEVRISNSADGHWPDDYDADGYDPDNPTPISVHLPDNYPDKKSPQDLAPIYKAYHNSAGDAIIFRVTVYAYEGGPGDDYWCHGTIDPHYDGISKTVDVLLGRNQAPEWRTASPE
jgi:hypothetical protein